MHPKLAVWQSRLDIFVSSLMRRTYAVIICPFSFVLYEISWTIMNRNSGPWPLSTTIWPEYATNFFLTSTIYETARGSLPLVTVANSPFEFVEMTTAVILALLCIHLDISIVCIVLSLNLFDSAHHLSDTWCFYNFNLAFCSSTFSYFFLFLIY